MFELVSCLHSQISQSTFIITSLKSHVQNVCLKIENKMLFKLKQQTEQR
jgi:hypothetical protein